MSVKTGQIFGSLATFFCPEKNVEWEVYDHDCDIGDPTRLVGSGKTLFDVETNNGWIELDEQHVSSWSFDEMGNFFFQGVGKLGSKWLVLEGDEFGHKVKDQDGIEYEVKSIKVTDIRGPHVTFPHFMDYVKYLGQRCQTLSKLAQRHKLDISEFLEYEDPDSDESSCEEEAQAVEEEAEVEIVGMNWEETAKFMYVEIAQRATQVVLNDQIKEQLNFMEKALKEGDWDEAIKLAALVRPLFRTCPYTEEVQDTVWKLDRDHLGTNLAHIKGFDEMQGLVKSHRYMKVYLLPKALLGNQQRLADSPLNVLYVSPRAERQFRNVHATLDTLVEESKDMEEGKKVQVDLDMKRIEKRSYLPNQVIYHIRGFKNFDMVVNVW